MQRQNEIKCCMLKLTLLAHERFSVWTVKTFPCVHFNSFTYFLPFCYSHIWNIECERDIIRPSVNIISTHMQTKPSYRVTNDSFVLWLSFNESCQLDSSISGRLNNHRQLDAYVKWINSLKMENNTIFYSSLM